MPKLTATQWLKNKKRVKGAKRLPKITPDVIDMIGKSFAEGTMVLVTADGPMTVVGSLIDLSIYMDNRIGLHDIVSRSEEHIDLTVRLAVTR